MDRTRKKIALVVQRSAFALACCALFLCSAPAGAESVGGLLKRAVRQAVAEAERDARDGSRDAGKRSDDVAQGAADPGPEGPALPIPASRLPMAAAASWGTVVVNADGSVTAWPDEADGRPVQVALPRRAVAAAVNQYAAFLLLDDGTVMAMGKNNYRALGREGEGSATPRPVPGLRGIVQVAATYGHALALRRDGAVFAWGEEATGLRGVLREGNAPVTRVPGLPPAVQVATAARHTLALGLDGRVYAWGNNAHGELGNGSTGEARTAAVVPGLDGVVAVAAGLQTSLALTSDGSVWAWGSNQSAMFGNGRRGESSAHQLGLSPVRLKGVGGVQQVVAGEGFVLARGGDGSVRAWGFDGYGGIGVGTAGGYHLTPQRIPTLSNVVNVNAGGYRAFATTADGRLWHWGTAIPIAPGRRPIVKRPAVLER